MSLLAATQIPKPLDEQAFERASVVLWCGLLKDPNVQRNGRRGQRQNGVDLFGLRNGDPTHHVGIQCKLKNDGQVLTENEVRDEVRKALTFKPELREYFIITTAADDVALQELARDLMAELHGQGRTLLIYVWGWNTLEEKISQDAEARKAFDPDYGPFGERLLGETQKVAFLQEETRADIGAGFSRVEAILMARSEAMLQVGPGDATVAVNALEAHLDADIDTFREIANSGKPRTALPLLEGLLARVKTSASGRILFRIKANIGACLLALGEDDKAASLLAEAYDHAPTEPKAIANRALSLLLLGRWQELLAFGEAELRRDPTNEGLAGYLVQAAHFNTSVEEPLDLLPEAVKSSAAVAVGRVDFLRHRRPAPEWREAARAAMAAHPDDPHAMRFAAEADLDEILNDDVFQRTRLLSRKDRARIEQVIKVLSAQWNDARASEGVLRPEDIALCSNIIVAFHVLDDMQAALEVARQGLALAPDDVEIAKRAAVAAIDAHDDEFAKTLLSKLPPGPDATVLAFRYHADSGDWSELAELYKTQEAYIPDVERGLITTAGRLAEIKIAPSDDAEDRVRAIAGEVAGDARASIVVADFARMEGFGAVSDAAFEAALKCIDERSHVAGRMMVAMHAARRGQWSVVADLLDGYVAEDHDSPELRTLARAFVNDTPIRHRAIRFYERLPRPIRDLPFYLHAQGLFCFNRGTLKQAETSLRKAIAAEPHLTNYLALFSTLRRGGRRAEIKPILEEINLAAIIGTPGQKMYLAQEMRAAGQPERALSYAYDVLQSSGNDPDAVLRYLGLLMMKPNERIISSVDAVGVDTWVRLEGAHGESYAFLIEDGEDRASQNIFSPNHPMASSAAGLKLGQRFTVASAIGENREWRVVEIKHKYLHALHDVMANFERRFPNANGFYTISTPEGDIQPALDQIKRVSESHRKLADIYLLRHLPMNMVAARLGGDSIGFAEYIRFLGRTIETCVGTESERLTARETIARHRAAGAVLDTYTAWTVATMNAFDVLATVFGKLVVPQSVIDELRILREKNEETGGPSMTVAWHNGQFIRQENTVEDTAARRHFISDQIDKIESACHVEPAAAPDAPSELASTLTQAFGSDVLDAANVATDGYVLLSEDMYFRQVAGAAVGVQGVWLQPIFAFARDEGLINHERYSEATVKLAWRQHNHVSIDPATLLDTLMADETEALDNFRALIEFIGTKNADMKSHLMVVAKFLNNVWGQQTLVDRKIMKATGALIDRLIRYRTADWALTLTLLKSDSVSELTDYIDRWVAGHFLPIEEMEKADREVAEFKARRLSQRLMRRIHSSRPTT